MDNHDTHATEKFPEIKPERTCDGCTACCEGWLPGEAYGKKFYPGSPCYYKCESKCSIYEDRPETPCRTYLCEWRQNLDFPEWLKPSISKVIVSRKHDEILNESFFTVTEMGQKIDSSILTWLFKYFLEKKISMMIQVGGGWNVFDADKIKKRPFNYQ